MKIFLHVPPKILDILLILAGFLLVGLIDHVTGEFVHVTSFYFIPLSYAGWRFGRNWGALAALLATTIWLVVSITTESSQSWYIWIANAFTQGFAFLVIAILAAVVSSNMQYERRMNRMDTLTGLRNRLAFAEEASVLLALCRRSGRPVAVAYLDLDNFKLVNDNLGHAMGDVLLQKVGQIIRTSLRESDISARLGGDEFVVFLPETGGEQALLLLERVRSQFLLLSEAQHYGVTGSIGVIVDEMAQSNVEELLQQADALMYTVKRNGKDQVVVAKWEGKKGSEGG